MWREPVDFSTNSVVTPTFSGVSLTKFKRTVLKTVENQFAMLTLGGKHKDAYRAQSVEHLTWPIKGGLLQPKSRNLYLALEAGIINHLLGGADSRPVLMDPTQVPCRTGDVPE